MELIGCKTGGCDTLCRWRDGNFWTSSPYKWTVKTQNEGLILNYYKNHVIWKIHYKDILVSPWINLMKVVNEVRMLTENYLLDSHTTLCNLQVTDDSPVFRVRGYGQSLLFESLLLEEVSNTGPGKKKKKNINLLKINNN